MSKREAAEAAETAESSRPAAVPDPEPGPDEVRVHLDGGKWVDMTRQLDGEDFLILYKLDALDPTDKTGIVALYGPIMSLIEKHAVRHNLGGPILRRPMPELMALWRAWNDAANAVALDPTPAEA